MEIILIALLTIGVIAFIAYPLFSPTREKLAQAPDALEALTAQRDSAYDAIRDLDLDFQSGKLSQDDYSALRDKYKARAAQLLQQIDTLTGDGATRQAESVGDASNDADAEAQIEAQVAKLRRAKTDVIEDEIARVRAARKSGAGFCGNCGTPRQANDKFCAKCGNKF